MNILYPLGMDILIEDLEGSLWCTAIDKKNKIQHLEIDPYAEIIRWGSLYIAKVTRIDKGQDAAYVDLGFGFEGILYLKDVRLDGALQREINWTGHKSRSNDYGAN